MSKFNILVNDETPYGEPTWWHYFENGRQLEVTHEEYDLPDDEQYYSVRLHCSNDEWDTRKYYNTCGVLAEVFFNEFDYEKVMKWANKANSEV